MFLSREGTPHQCPGDEGCSLGFEYLPTEDHEKDLDTDKQQCQSDGVPKKARCLGISDHVQAGSGDHHLVVASHG